MQLNDLNAQKRDLYRASSIQNVLQTVLNAFNQLQAVRETLFEVKFALFEDEPYRSGNTILLEVLVTSNFRVFAIFLLARKFDENFLLKVQ